MRKFLVAVIALIAAATTACPPPVPAVDTLNLGTSGTWTAPTAGIVGTHSAGQFPTGSNSSITVKATVGVVEEAEFHFRLEDTTTVPDIAVGTYVLQPLGAGQPLQVLFTKTAAAPTPIMSLDGTVTITELTFGAPIVGPSFTTKPISRLRATFSATFDQSAVVTTGSISIG